MSSGNGKNGGAASRARGYSHQSALWKMDDDQGIETEQQPVHPGIPIGGPGPVRQSSPIPIKGSSSLHQSRRSARLSLTTTSSGSESEKGLLSADEEDEGHLRKWGGGSPPKKAYLGTGEESSPRYLMPRRSTLADKPELDSLLHATMVEYKGQKYLPLSARTLHRLSPFWKGAKPVADMKIFEYIMITHEVNNVHADRVVAALERIGHHCSHLLVMAPVQTSELGDVFNREADNVSTGNDWQQILQCFPNLKWLMFVHHDNVPDELSRYTFPLLCTAVANRQVAESLQGFDFKAPPSLLAYVPHNTMTMVTTAKTSGNTT